MKRCTKTNHRSKSFWRSLNDGEYISVSESISSEDNEYIKGIANQYGITLEWNGMKQAYRISITGERDD